MVRVGLQTIVAIALAFIVLVLLLTLFKGNVSWIPGLLQNMSENASWGTP